MRLVIWSFIIWLAIWFAVYAKGGGGGGRGGHGGGGGHATSGGHGGTGGHGNAGSHGSEGGGAHSAVPARVWPPGYRGPIIHHYPGWHVWRPKCDNQDHKNDCRKDGW